MAILDRDGVMTAVELSCAELGDLTAVEMEMLSAVVAHRLGIDPARLGLGNQTETGEIWSILKETGEERDDT